MVKQLFALVLLAVLLALASCDQSAGKTYPSLEAKAAIAGCEQAVREEAEVSRSVVFSEILDDHNYVLRQENLTIFVIDGEFTQQVGDRLMVRHFYGCMFRDGKIDAISIYTGHPADFDETASLSLCRQAIAQRSEDPDLVVFKPEEADPAFGVLPYWTFDGTVHLMNALGAMVPHRYFCHVSHGEIRELKLTEKD